jgi:DNA-binding MarR family transcriptional regulator
MADERLANVLGAFALAVSDELEAATEHAAGGHAGAGPAALVGLSDLLAGRSVDDLRRAVGLTHSGGVRVVDRLVAEGLAERRPGPDGRSVALGLTPQGRRLAGDIGGARMSALQETLAVLDDGERAQLATILDKLVAGVVTRRLEARRAGAPPPGGWLCRLCDPVACERPEGNCPAANAAATSAGAR